MFRFWVWWPWSREPGPAVGDECLDALGQGFVWVVKTTFPGQLEGWRAGQQFWLLVLLNGCGAKYILFTLSFCGKSFEVWLGLSHQACCLAPPKVFLSSDEDWVGGGRGLASQKLRGKGTCVAFLKILLRSEKEYFNFLGVHELSRVSEFLILI